MNKLLKVVGAIGCCIIILLMALVLANTLPDDENSILTFSADKK